VGPIVEPPRRPRAACAAELQPGRLAARASAQRRASQVVWSVGTPVSEWLGVGDYEAKRRIGARRARARLCPSRASEMRAPVSQLFARSRHQNQRDELAVRVAVPATCAPRRPRTRWRTRAAVGASSVTFQAIFVTCFARAGLRDPAMSCRVVARMPGVGGRAAMGCLAVRRINRPLPMASSTRGGPRGRRLDLGHGRTP
jgi:hypothetical protein